MIKHLETSGKYAKDTLTRPEVEAINKAVEPILKKHAAHHLLCGSYRRGKTVIGDVDYVVTNCDLATISAEIQQSLKVLEVSRQGKSLLTVVIKWKKKEAQVEFLNVAENEWGSALLHTTGNGNFNQFMRGFAKAKGLKLNQHGLFRVKGNVKLASAFEWQVLEELGFAPIPPTERSVQSRAEWGALKQKYLKDANKNYSTDTTKALGGKTWTVKSASNPKLRYLVNRSDAGKWTCRVKGTGELCPAFKYNRERPQTCKHIKFIQKKEKK